MNLYQNVPLPRNKTAYPLIRKMLLHIGHGSLNGFGILMTGIDDQNEIFLRPDMIALLGFGITPTMNTGNFCVVGGQIPLLQGFHYILLYGVVCNDFNSLQGIHDISSCVVAVSEPFP